MPQLNMPEIADDLRWLNYKKEGENLAIRIVELENKENNFPLASDKAHEGQ